MSNFKSWNRRSCCWNKHQYNNENHYLLPEYYWSVFILLLIRFIFTSLHLWRHVTNKIWKLENLWPCTFFRQEFPLFLKMLVKKEESQSSLNTTLSRGGNQLRVSATYSHLQASQLVAWRMQCECVVLLTMACMTVPYIFPHYLINGTIFKKKKNTEHKIFIFILSTTFFI